MVWVLLTGGPWTTHWCDTLIQRNHSLLPKTSPKCLTHMQCPLLLHSALVFLWSSSSKEMTQRVYLILYNQGWQTDHCVSPGKHIFFSLLPTTCFPYELNLSWKHWAQLYYSKEFCIINSVPSSTPGKHRDIWNILVTEHGVHNTQPKFTKESPNKQAEHHFWMQIFFI